MLNLRNKKQLLSTPDGLPVIGGEEKLDFNMPEAANSSNGFDYSNDADLSKHLGISDEAAVPLGGDFQDALPQIDPVVQEALRRGEEFQAERSQPEVASNTLIDSRGLPIIGANQETPVQQQTSGYDRQQIADEIQKSKLPVIGAVDPIDAQEAELAAEYAKIGKRDPAHKHSKWSRIAAAIEGWAKGGLFAGIAAARDPHHFERQQDEAERRRLLPQIEAVQKIKDARLDANYRKAQIGDVLAKPEDRDAERKRKEEKDLRDYDHKVKTLDWKKEDRDRWFELEDVKQKAKERNDQRTYELAVRKQNELERNNKAVIVSREKIAGDNNNTRKEIANITQTGATGRANTAIAAKNDAQAKQTLIAIEASNSTPAQKEKAKAELFRLHPTLKP